MLGKRILSGAAVILAVVCTAPWARAASPEGMKLYAFSSGALTIGKGVLQNFGPMDPPIQIPVGFFVIKHPKGNVLFDTGNNDKIIKDPSYWGASFNALKPVNTPDVAIDAQLAEDRPQARRHQVCRRQPHASRPWRQRRQVPELDHRGAEGRDRERVLAEGRARAALHDRRRLPLQAPRTATTPTPSRCCSSRVTSTCSATAAWWSSAGSRHTPGSQMMTVRLKNTGPIILTGDNVYFRENVEKRVPPNIVLAYDPSGILSAYDWIRYDDGDREGGFLHRARSGCLQGR